MTHSYAREELVAELGAAFLCADLDLTPEVREDHAGYIGSWLQVLQNDKRAIFSAAAHTQRAVDYLQGRQGPPPVPLFLNAGPMPGYAVALAGLPLAVRAHGAKVTS